MTQAIFTKITAAYTVNPRLIQQLWNEIESTYSHPKRHYHNLSHLGHLLDELSAVEEQVQDWDILVFSVFYHDIVYNPLRRDNKERSISIAENRLSTIDVPPEKIRACSAQILYTKTHEQSPDPDTNFFTDADLSILGQEWEIYQNYSAAIRKEYALYPDMIYKPGRKNVVQQFLDMNRIFKTAYFFERYEKQARKNLQKELEQLT